MAKVGLSSPWILFYHEVEAFFKNDEEVTVIYDEDKNHLKLYVNNITKAEALSQLIPIEKNFGQVDLKISVIPSNNAQEKNLLSISPIKDVKGLMVEALRGNKSVSKIEQVNVFTNPLIYVVFKPEIIQYFTDSLGDINGLCSTLNQEIVKEIFKEIDNVCYCTEKVSTISAIKVENNGWICTASSN